MDDDNVLTFVSPWMSLHKLATQQGVSPRTVYRWLKSGKVESRVLGDTTQYRMCHDIPTDTPLSPSSSDTLPTDTTCHDSVICQLTDALEQAHQRERELVQEVAELRAQHTLLEWKLEQASQHSHPPHFLVRLFNLIKRLFS